MVTFYVFDLDNTLAPTDEVLSLPTLQRNTFVNYENLFLPNYRLKECLLSVKGPKFIASNGTTDHVHQVLRAMQLDECFEGSQSRSENTDPSCLKPFLKFYTDLLLNLTRFAGQHQININDVQIVYFDDILENLIVPNKFGWITVHISPSVIPHRHENITRPRFSFPNVVMALERLILSNPLLTSSPS